MKKKQKSKSRSVGVETLIDVIRYLNTVPFAQRGAVAKALGIKPSKAARALAYLEVHNHVEHIGRDYGLGRIVKTSKPSRPIVALDEICNSRRTTSNKNNYTGATIRNLLPISSEENEDLAGGDEATTGGVAPCCGAVAGAHRDGEKPKSPIEVRAIKCLLYHAVTSWKAHNAKEGRLELADASYRGDYWRWDGIQDLLLNLVRAEPMAYLLWDGGKDRICQELDDVLPDWKNSMEWATRKVLGEALADGDNRECDESGPTWIAEEEDAAGAAQEPIANVETERELEEDWASWPLIEGADVGSVNAGMAR